MLFPEAKEYHLTFLEKKQLSKDAYTFLFKRPGEFEYLAGQYQSITLPIPETVERGNERVFSLVTNPLEKARLAITTRIIQSDFKKTLVSLSPGTQLQSFGPMGRF